MNTEHKVNLSLTIGVLALLLSLVSIIGGGFQQEPLTGPEGFFQAQAKEAGIRSSTFEQCLTDPSIEERINQEVAEAGSIGGQGTPFNVIAFPDGTLIPVPGAYPYEVFSDVIDRGLAGELTEDELESSYQIEDIRDFDPEIDYFKGAQDAEVTIFEWSDYECPYCARVHGELQRVVDNYPNVNWVYRQLPLSFHEQAVPAAKAALCIGREEGNEAYWNFTDTLFSDQSVLQN